MIRSARSLPRLLGVVAVAASTAACGTLPWYAEETATTTASDAEYQPVYYGEQVVYFDDAGSPYYYDGPRVVWIGPTWPGYAGYVRHYHMYGPRYRVWAGGHVHSGGWVHRGPHHAPARPRR